MLPRIGPISILTVADDLLKNDGRRFLEMMEQLAAERRLAREEEAAGKCHSEDGKDESHGDEGEDEDSDGSADNREDSDAEDEEDEEWEEAMMEEQKMEESKRMFSIFAARMFEQRVLKAYRRKPRDDAANAARVGGTEAATRQMAVDEPILSRPQPHVATPEFRPHISGGRGGDGGDGGILGGHGGVGEGPTLGARSIVVNPSFQNLVEQPNPVFQASLLAVLQLTTKALDKISQNFGRTSLFFRISSNEFLLDALRIVSFVYSFRIADFVYTRIVFPRLASLAGGPRLPALP
ncbi:Stress response protein NST1 [Mycena sanguinolenta]|uniref:Stress response protein NST1 n=1 Tax=Mycena sanguinolenta TaxID=230812 RepID=A0A8H7DJR1_9AGAR|nr:Stress response protein NST1 [Mycena sanguinolenta]